MAEADKVKIKSAKRPDKGIGAEKQGRRLMLYKLRLVRGCLRVCSLMLTRVSLGYRSVSRFKISTRTQV